jgi:hypothetical protein
MKQESELRSQNKSFFILDSESCVLSSANGVSKQ